MSFDLTNKNIQDTFQNLLQKTGSDNRLYDLQGNEITNLRINGDLIADQYIVSSSVTNVTTLAQSGSTIFGDTTDDIHQFTGSLTTQGSMTAYSMSIGVNQDYDSNLMTMKANTGKVYINDELFVTGSNPEIRITKNGGAWGSGEKAFVIDDYAGNEYFKVIPNMSNAGVWNAGQDYYGPTSDIYAKLRINDGHKFYWGNTDIKASFSSDGFVFNYTKNDINFAVNGADNTIIKADAGTERVGIGNNVPTKKLTVSGSISASGKFYPKCSDNTLEVEGSISASGNLIIGSLDGTYISASVGQMEISGSGTAQLEVQGHITASGNISSSGTITTNTLSEGNTTKGLTLTGNITASGNISASGGIIATGNIESDGTIIGDGLNINGTTTFNDGNITNVGDITLDSISDDATGGDTSISLESTQVSIDVAGATNQYMTGTSYKIEVPITASENISSSNTSGLHSFGGNVGIGTNALSDADLTINDTEINAPTPGVTVFAATNASTHGLIISGGLAGGNPTGYIDTLQHTELWLGENGDAYVRLSLDRVHLDKDTTVDGHITSSGDISASVALQGKHLILSGGTDVFTSASLASAIAGGGGGSTNAAGSDTQVQFNDGGTNFGGDAGLVYNSTTNILTAGAITSSGGITVVGGNISGSSESVFSGQDALFRRQILVGGAGSQEANGTISATGNISSSLTSTGSFGRIETRGNISSSATSTGSFGKIELDAGINAGSSLVVGGSQYGNGGMSDDGHYTFDIEGQIVFDANGSAIQFKDDGSTSFAFNLDSTPELDVTGDFTLDGSGDIKLDSATNVVDLVGNVTASGNLNVAGEISSSEALFVQGTDLDFVVSASSDTLIQVDGDISASGGYFGSRTFETGSNIVGAVGSHSGGDIVYFGQNSGLTAGTLYYLNTGGTWTAADASDNTAGADELLGIALGANAITDGVLLRGVVRVNNNISNVGRALYMSTTAGEITGTAPSGNNEIVRIVGYCLHATNEIMYFNPSAVWVKVSA